MNRLLGCILLLTIVAVIGGCGGQSDKQTFANIKGKVTYNGKPIEKGQITFAVEGYPPKSMKIVDGAFNGQAMVGTNKISVSAKKKVANPPKLSKEAQIQLKGYMEKKANPKEGGGTLSEYDASAVEYIPKEWGPLSKETRVVESGSANDFEFNITGPK
jgi:hypothetical protein